MVVEGIRRVDFEDNNGTDVRGYSIFLSDEFPPLSNAFGRQFERIFLTDRRYSECFGDKPFDALLGLEVRVFYNRFGKVASVEIL